MNLCEQARDNDILSGLVLPSLHSSVRGRVIAKGVLASETLWQVWWEMMDVIALHASGRLTVAGPHSGKTRHTEPHEKEHVNYFIGHYMLHTGWNTWKYTKRLFFPLFFKKRSNNRVIWQCGCPEAVQRWVHVNAGSDRPTYLRCFTFTVHQNVSFSVFEIEDRNKDRSSPAEAW